MVWYDIWKMVLFGLSSFNIMQLIILCTLIALLILQANIPSSETFHFKMGKCKFNDSWLKTFPWLHKKSQTEALCTACNATLSIGRGVQSLQQHNNSRKHGRNFKAVSSNYQFKAKHAAGSTKTTTILKAAGTKNPVVADVSNTNADQIPACNSTANMEASNIGTNDILVPTISEFQNSTSQNDKSVPEKSQKSIVEMFSPREGATKAELIWSLKCVASNFSANSCNGLVDVFRAMCPDFPEHFSLGRMKIYYLLTEALGPYFHKKMADDIHRSKHFYSLLFDETTNCENEKELRIMVRYWSESVSMVVTNHLHTFFMGEATAALIVEKILFALNHTEVNLPLQKLLMLGSDGPNVNKAIYTLLNKEVESLRSRNLLNIGSCNIHTVHNAFLKGLSELGEECSEVIILTRKFFNKFPRRQEQFREVQLKLKLPKHVLIKHVKTRWLTMEHACGRYLEQLPAIKQYFLKVIPKTYPELMKTSSYKIISAYLRKSIVEAELEFLISVANIYNKFTAFFQRNEPLLHILFVKLRSIIVTLSNRVCKSGVSADTFNDSSISIEALFGENNLLPLNEIVTIKEVKTQLKDLSEVEQMAFRKKMQAHYIASCKYLLKKTCLKPEFMLHEKFRFMCPEEVKKKQSAADLVDVVASLPLDISTDVIIDEWKLIQCEDIKQQNGQSIVDVWQPFFEMKTTSGELKYPNISLLLKHCFSLSHGNADVERSFSESAHVVTPNKTRMDVRTLNAKMNIKNELKLYNNKPELVPISKELLVKAQKARASYENYKVEEKKKKEAEINRKKEALLLKQKQEENLKKLKIQSDAINALKDDLKVKKTKLTEKRKAYDEVFQLGQKKLKKATDKSDMAGVRVAQALLGSAQTLKNEESDLIEETTSIQKKFDIKIDQYTSALKKK